MQVRECKIRYNEPLPKVTSACKIEKVEKVSLKLSRVDETRILPDLEFVTISFKSLKMK